MHRVGPPVSLVLRASPIMRAMQWVFLLLAATAVYLSQLPVVGVLLLLPLVWFSLRRAGRGFPVHLTLHSDGAAERLDADGQPRPVQLLAFYERGPVGVLVLVSEGTLQRLPWAFDSLPRGPRRDLRLWMRDHARATATTTAVSSPQASSPE